MFDMLTFTTILYTLGGLFFLFAMAFIFLFAVMLVGYLAYQFILYVWRELL